MPLTPPICDIIILPLLKEARGDTNAESAILGLIPKVRKGLLAMELVGSSVFWICRNLHSSALILIA